MIVARGAREMTAASAISRNKKRELRHRIDGLLGSD
jgi:hypothetical protein